nr:hypothetical protein CFP56_15364 [Quercus suber]
MRWGLDFGLLIVKGDLSVVYNTTMGEEGAGSTFGHITMGIKRSAKTFMNIVFHLTRRDVNQAAHVFARQAQDEEDEQVWIEDTPPLYCRSD